MKKSLFTLTVLLLHIYNSVSWSTASTSCLPPHSRIICTRLLLAEEGKNQEWTSDFDDYYPSNGDDNTKDDNDEEEDDKWDVSSLLKTTKKSSTPKTTISGDLSAIQTRQFSLGEDIQLINYVGSMGFDEVTDWEYYYPSEDDDNPDDRQVVQPNPLLGGDQPKRTRTSSGAVVRVFSAEFVGRLGGTLRAQGMDSRIIIKEFSGTGASQLAVEELLSMSELQSELLSKTENRNNNDEDDIPDYDDDDKNNDNDWMIPRSIQDDRNVQTLLKELSTAPVLGILGQVELSNVEFPPNDFYQAFRVKPPSKWARWIVYEYQGFNTVATYSVPPSIRRSNLPPKRGLLGNLIEPPPLPPFEDRANYIIRGILQQSLEALATLHDTTGRVHRSIGRTSLILTTRQSQDKRESSSIYATNVNDLRVKLSDFGFSTSLGGSNYVDEEFVVRARSFGLSFRPKEDSIATRNFAMAEDLHALGFVILGLFLTSLANSEKGKTTTTILNMTDEDSLQRLLGDIFDKDMTQFRDFLLEEEDDVWKDLVLYLDKYDGWRLLESMLQAREKAAAAVGKNQMITARGLLQHPLFTE
mmetsp:Transcript_13529/g.19961  ORF Transcript_13529/g.19961 Transcript_13529/m.19961 type:complete len:583 (-) Transcript_13529:9-1757(-)